MARVAIIGATGSLGSEILRQAVKQHEVTAVVRSPHKLAANRVPTKCVAQLDLETCSVERVAEVVAGHQVVVNAAGHVDDGHRFVDRLPGWSRESKHCQAVTSRPAGPRRSGDPGFRRDRRRGVNLPVIKSRYWPHWSNYQRLSNSKLNWRMLCPGPLSNAPPLRSAPLRASLDHLPVSVSPWVLRLPSPLLTLMFARIVPQMIISYEDAAAFILDNVTEEKIPAGHRVGLALPVGMRGLKSNWSGKRE